MLPGMTSVGNETNMALWTQVATGSGTGAGVDVPTHVTLSNPFVLNAGTLYGIAVVADPAISAPLHQRQWIESKLFQCGPVPCPRIRHQRAVYRAGVHASRLEWDDLLHWRSAAAAVQLQRQHLQRRAAARQVRSTCSSPIPIPPRLRSCRARSWPSQAWRRLTSSMRKQALPLWLSSSHTRSLCRIAISRSWTADTLGNNLADYVDGGGVVVQYGFSHYGPGQPYGINGRWASGNYNPYSYSTNIQFNPFSLGTFNAGHPLMAGVTMLNSDFENVVSPAAGATEVAQDNFADSLVAYRPVSGGHTTVGVTAYVGSDATQSGDWGKVIVNAGRWLISGPCGTPSTHSRQHRDRPQRRLRANREVRPGRGHRQRR